MKKPLVAIVGRPNVGKSTFFNHICGRRISIVKDEPGVTRDRIYADAEWLGNLFTVVDTGGIDFCDATEVQKNILNQATMAIELADVILFFVDGREGLTAADKEIADFLRKHKKPIILCVNKLDNNEVEKSYEFYELNLGEPFVVSAEQSMGFGEVLDEVVKHFKTIVSVDDEEETIKIAIVGKPNAGKSSITNCLLGENRVVVSNVAGTTRDAIDTPFNYNGKKYVLIDTAGIRRKRGIELASVESYSVIRSMEAIKRADVVLIVFDASEPVSEQDVRIAGYVHEANKPSVVVMNKWDLVSKNGSTINEYNEKLNTDLSFMSYFMPLYVSALEGKRIGNIMPAVIEAYENASQKIKTSTLNEVLQDAISTNQPPSKNGKRVKFYFVAQTGSNPPSFTFSVNDKNIIHFSYERYLENRFRSAFNLKGTPIKFYFKNKNDE